ncbi:LpxL/LpxP family Kdo(2)-lipid IV(A) lauroyl/palmitoleoyl acyltransferase [Allohahella sp. A8]|uniref:LpxL/LpxP family Kdo(2)-lipid IV(A) lauroyl/palmitoleoyl acyltransferase n=1 Tax=Allohahella sp. A8 TaxID=3141461 RepID=UPI003A80B1FD
MAADTSAGNVNANPVLDQRPGDFLAPRFWPTWLLIGLLKLISRLSIRNIQFFGRLLGKASYYLLRSRRSITRTNIQLCFPELSAPEQERLVYASFEANGIGFLEAAAVWFNDLERFRPISRAYGLEHLENAIAEGKGVLLLGGHFATIDLAGALFNLFAKADVMQRDHNNPLFNYYMTRGRSRYCQRILNRGGLRGALRSLKEGRVVWYATDQDYGRQNSTFAPFFGVPAATITTTSKIAARTGCLVLQYSHFRNIGGYYEVHFSRPLTNYPSGDETADAAATNRLLENEIRRFPEQYLWMHRRFKTRPDPAEPSPYKVVKKRKRRRRPAATNT